MRLGWPFGRRTAAPASDAPSRPAPEAAADRASADGPRDAWRAQAPLQPTLSRPPLTAPARPFVEGLAGSQAPDPILESIGRTADLRPMSGSLPGAALPSVAAYAGSLPQPANAGAQLASARAQASSTASSLSSAVGGSDAEASSLADAPTVAMAPGGLPAQMAPRSVPVVAASAAPMSASGSVTPRPTAASHNETAVGRPSLARLSPLQRRALEPALPAPGILSLDPVRPQSGKPADNPGLAQDVAVRAQPSVEASVPRAASAGPRRPGLGAPLNALPGSVASAPAPTSAGGHINRVQRRSLDEASSQGPALPMPAPVAPRMRPNVWRIPADDGPVGAAGDPRSDVPHALGPSRPHSAGGPNTSPGTQASSGRTLLAGPALPLVQRAPITEPPADKAPDANSSSELGTSDRGPGAGDVSVDRSEGVAAAARELKANAFTAGGVVHVPASAGPLDRGHGAALLRHELVHVGQQRRLGANLPAEGTDAGRRLETEARAAETRGSFARQLPLAPARRLAAAADAASGSSSSEGAHQPSGSQIQMASSDQEVPSATAAPPAELAVIQRRDASAGSAPGAAPGSNAGHTQEQDEHQLDELAGRLYDRLRNHLRRELLADRDRAGYVADVR